MNIESILLLVLVLLIYVTGWYITVRDLRKRFSEKLESLNSPGFSSVRIVPGSNYLVILDTKTASDLNEGDVEKIAKNLQEFFPQSRFVVITGLEKVFELTE